MARFRLQALRTCWEVAGAQQALSGADEILPTLHWSSFFEASETAAGCQGEHCLTTFNVRLLSVGSHTSFSLPPPNYVVLFWILIILLLVIVIQHKRQMGGRGVFVFYLLFFRLNDHRLIKLKSVPPGMC